MVERQLIETNGKGETKVLSTERYWEKGDLYWDTYLKRINVCDGDCRRSIEYYEKGGLARIPTQEEINNYRLEKCKKDYPVGSKFKGMASGGTYSIMNEWRIWDNGNIVNVGIVVYDADTDTYAEIVEQSPLEKLKEYTSQQYPDDTILRDRINNLNQ